MTAAEHLARFVTDLALEAIPTRARDYAKLSLIDTLGIALAGYHEPSTHAARCVALQHGGEPQATLLVHGRQVPAPQAALVNGTASFSHNFTDTTLSCVIHAGPVIIPAALAMGEATGASGADVLTAIVAGYEVMSRVGNAINAGSARMSHHRKGYHPTGTCGVFGAAAVAAKLLGLSTETTCHSLGIAGSFAAGLSESLTDGTDTWRAHGGFAAQNGITAALLAREGLTGPTGVFDGQRGFCTAFTDGHYDASALERHDDDAFLILDTAFKLHNTAHVWALPLDALAALCQQHRFTAADVDEMIVTFPQTWTAIMDDPSGATYAPVSYAQATNNLRYCLAVGLHDGKVYVEQFDDAHLHDAAILETARRVTPRPDADLGRIFETSDKATTHLEVMLKSGSHVVLQVDYPRGSPQNPATMAELEAKFDALSASVLPSEQLTQLKARLFALEDEGNLGAVMAALSHPAGSR
jgi:2-methylcitrate dehydratase PrpD